MASLFLSTTFQRESRIQLVFMTSLTVTVFLNVLSQQFRAVVSYRELANLITKYIAELITCVASVFTIGIHKQQTHDASQTVRSVAVISFPQCLRLMYRIVLITS